MSRSRHAQAARRKHPVVQTLRRLRPLQRIRPLASVLFFGGAVLVSLMAIAALSVAHGSGTGASGNPIPGKATAIANARCGFANKPACPTYTVPWVSLRSESPADVLAAAESTTMFQSALTDADPIGVALRKGKLGQPALVKPYRDGTTMDTEWVIPVVSSSEAPGALLEFVYDRPHQRLRAASFIGVGSGMFYGSHPFPFIDSIGASTVVRQARNVSTMAGQAAELVYFPTDHAAVLTGQSPPWTSGGDSVSDPMWRVPGGDGHWYYVTHDKQVHLASEFPVDGAFPAMPQLV
jgi:hypothetical protein